MYCSFCAANLEPGQAMCPRCGRETGAVAGEERPGSVRVAALLLLIAWGIGLLSLSGLFVQPGLIARLPAYFFARTIALAILWIVLTILIWNRQGWARIGIVLVLVWSIGTLLFNLLRMPGGVAMAVSLAVPVVVDVLRICAVYLLTKPESNKWYSKSAS
jgi:Na+/proline symporter